MKTPRLPFLLLLVALVLALPARAVYAPIPEEEQGKALTFYVGARIYHDSNLFAARTGSIDSFVYELAPEVKFNASLTPQTFASAGYKLTANHIADRPGSRNLASHDLSARIAHQFSDRLTLDVYDFYSIAKNPQSLLAGVTLNTDQSYRRNELGGSLAVVVGPRFALTLRGSAVNYDYDNTVLATSINRDESQLGLEGAFDLRPELKLLAEYRHQMVDYATGGATKDKRSDFFLVGAKYTASQQLSLSVRLGGESRHRSGAADFTSPYAEASVKYDYGPRSFVSAGYARTVEETSNIALYNDVEVNRLFVNLQHQVAGSVVASGSLTYEPSRLQGRSPAPSNDEDTVRFGLALTWVAAKHWTVSGTLDYDRVSSEDITREYDRVRVGVGARLTF